MPSDIEIPASSYRAIRRSGSADPATRRLALIAGGLGAALVVIVGAWMVMGHRSGGVPLVMADMRPIRVKPANPGGMQVVGANEDVMSSRSGDGQENLAPAPETPQIQALKAQIQAAKKDEQPAQLPAPVATAAPMQPAPVPAAPQVAPRSAPQSAMAAAQPPVANAPSAPPRAVAPASLAPAPLAPTRAGGVQVQLAALPSQQGAETEWQRLTRRAPTLLGGRQPAIERAEVEGRTVYRLRTGGFADMAAATEFCAQLRAKGAGCSIASF